MKSNDEMKMYHGHQTPIHYCLKNAYSNHSSHRTITDVHRCSFSLKVIKWNAKFAFHDTLFWKTNFPKNVAPVWFRNANSKWRNKQLHILRLTDIAPALCSVCGHDMRVFFYVHCTAIYISHQEMGNGNDYVGKGIGYYIFVQHFCSHFFKSSQSSKPVSVTFFWFGNYMFHCLWATLTISYRVYDRRL